MNAVSCFALLVLLGAGSPRPAVAQPALSDSAQISLVTILPGDAVYSLFGHSAVRVYDPAQGIDVAFNYGTFDFGNPLTFVGEFAYGKLDYFLDVHAYPAAVHAYWEIEGRPIIEQVLTLSPPQRNAIFQFLQYNALPEHRYYRYDFFFDNCATRIRDAFEQVLGDVVQFAPADPDLTFRQLIDPYASEQPFLDLGMDLGLGLPADRMAAPHETMFLPDYLMAAFEGATIEIDGTQQPLVARTDTVAWSAQRATLDPAWPWPTVLMWILCILGTLLTARDIRTGPQHRRLLDGLLYGLAGLSGLIIIFLWFISLHVVTHGNFNVLWAWPTHLIVAGVLVRRAQPRWLPLYLAAAAVTALIVALGWMFWPQTLPAAVLPLTLLLAIRSSGLAFMQRTNKQDTPVAPSMSPS